MWGSFSGAAVRTGVRSCATTTTSASQSSINRALLTQGKTPWSSPSSLRANLWRESRRSLFVSSRILSPEIEGKVMEAVKKYVEERKEDLRKEMMEESVDKNACQKKLDLLETSQVSGSSKWADFDFDELDRVEVLLEIEEAMDLQIPDEDADAISGVEDSVEWLSRKAKQDHAEQA